MLDRLGQKLYTFVLGFIVILLSVVFALQFGGPQAEGCSASGPTFYAKVYGDTITEGEFRAAYTLAGFDRYDRETAERQGLRQMILDGLVERVLLARAAREAGFTADESDVKNRLRDQGTVFLSVGVNSGQPSGEVAVPVKNRDGEYDAEGAENFVKYGLRRSVPEFVEMQIEETLAQRMRDTVRATVEISPNEIWETFVRESDTVTLDYVRFSPSYYRDEVDPTDADIRAWMDENGEAVDREYQANRHRYTGLEPQVRSRHILVEAGSDASDEVREAARARATALLARARAGEDFAALARQNSDDTASARRGGDLGYNPRGRMVREFDEAQFAMAVDEISDVVETQFGFHVIQVTGTREGDVPEDEAKLELSDRLYREARAEGLAREAAEQALAALAGGMSPSELDDQLAGRTPADEGSPESEEGVDEEVVEEERNPLAPHVEHTRPFGRADTPISGPFDNGPLVRKAFELTEDAPLPEDIVQLGDDFFVFRLAERHRADRDEFDDEVRARIGTGLTAVKQREALGLYVHRLRAEAEAEGAILINDEAFLSGAEPDEEEDDGTGEDEGDED